MLRATRLRGPACAAALGVLAFGPGWTPAAVADTTDGTLTVVVDRDVDGNGAYDAQVDRPQSGIGITVSDAAGHAVKGVTDATGKYVVAPGKDLAGGRYFVVANIPADLVLVPVPESDTFAPLSTTVDLTSEDQDVRLGVAERAVSVPPPEPPPTTEPAPAPQPGTRVAKPQPRFAVGDRVWADGDGQGRQDAAERGVRGISVQLLDGAGKVVESTTTGAEGRYRFDDLPTGVYSVRFAGIPGGSKLSPAAVGDASADSDPDYTGVTAPFRLEVGADRVRAATAADGVSAGWVNPTVDAGVAPLQYAVGSVVWQDLDRDGIQDPGEPAGHARVGLLQAGSDRPVATTTTDDEGRFLFAHLGEGRYRLRFDLRPHQRVTAPLVGGDSATDSDPRPATNETDAFVLDPSSPDLVPASDFGRPVDADYVNPTVGAGVVGSYVIRDWVWRDVDGNGRQSAADIGVAGVRVDLLDRASHLVGRTRTHASGRFAFKDLPAGQYRLRFRHLPSGLFFLAPGAGGDPTSDSDVYRNSLTAPITVGDEHPAETAVGAGLTTSAAAAASTDAPSSVSSAATSVSAAREAASARSLGGTGGPNAAFAVAGVLLALGGLTLLVLRRRRAGSGQRLPRG